MRKSILTKYPLPSQLSRKEQIYLRMMMLGSASGCHQRADRSFKYKGYQFPVCARCTGVLIGYLLSVPMYLFWGESVLLCISCMGVMFIDWLIQYLKICSSTNLRRLFTGIAGGYGLMTIQIMILVRLCRFVAQFL